MNDPAPWKKLIRPKHWPSWLGIAVLYCISRLPYRTEMAIGKGIGKLMYLLVPRRRHITRVNIKLCFPELNEKEQDRLIKNIFASVGMGIIETGIAWFWPEHKLQKIFHVHHQERVIEALRAGKGILLMGAHYTSLDIAGRLYSTIQSVSVVAREQNNLVIDRILKKNRNKGKLNVIHRHDLRSIFQKLKQNNVVWYAPDQDYGKKHSLFAPFFKIPTATITTVPRFAKISGAIILPISHFRREDNTGYDITLHPPLKNFPSNDIVADLAQINLVIENIIRTHPEQYLWLHRRFKTRPEGETGFY